MSAENIAGLVIAVGLLVVMVLALLFPERF
ncbi:MAG: K(+)-transporting ATPase subunit F [Mycobacteriales bacterium]